MTKRGRVKKSDSESNNSAYYENVGSYFELALKSFGEAFRTETYLSKPSQVLAQNSLNKNNVEDKLFGLPPNWIWCTIGDVVEMAQNLTIEVELSANTLINYVDIDAIDNKRYKLREIKQKSVKELSSRARRVLRKGYVVYSLVRPYLNNLAIIEEDRENLIGSTGFAAFRCIQVHNEYIKFWLLTPFIRSRYLKYMSGFNSPGISSGQFYSTPIPLPPIEEQIDIVALIKGFESNNFSNYELSGLDSIISRINQVHKSQESCLQLKAELTHQLSLVKQLRQAFLREAMQGKLVPQDPNDEPASELLKRIKAEKEQLIKEKKIKKEKELPPIKPEEIPFEIPKSWMWCRLGEVTEVYGGLTLGRRYSGKLGNVPYLRVANVQRGFIDTSKMKYLSLPTEIISNYLLRNEDILVNEGGDFDKVGRCSIWDSRIDPCIHQNHLFKVRCSRLSSKFIEYCINSDSSRFYFLGNYKKSTNLASINRTKLVSLPIALPPLSEQKRIVSKLEQLMNFCDELKHSIKQSQKQNEQLLQQVLLEALQPKKEYEQLSLATKG